MGESCRRRGCSRSGEQTYGRVAVLGQGYQRPLECSWRGNASNPENTERASSGEILEISSSNPAVCLTNVQLRIADELDAILYR